MQGLFLSDLENSFTNTKRRNPKHSRGMIVWVSDIDTSKVADKASIWWNNFMNKPTLDLFQLISIQLKDAVFRHNRFSAIRAL